MDIDSVIDEHATFGWWHVIAFLLISLCVCFTGLVDLTFLFMQEIPDNVCKTQLSQDWPSGWSWAQIQKVT